MGFIQDLIEQQLTSTVKEKLGTQAGTSGTQTDAAIQAALAAILSGLQKNTQSTRGAEELNSALDQHDGSILDDITGAVSSSAIQTDGNKILDHVLGASKQDILEQISKKTGINKNALYALMIALAPVVLGQLGKLKKQKDMGSKDVQDEVQKEQAPAGGLGDILAQVLGGGSAKKPGGNDDGFLDDAIRIGKDLLGSKSQG